MEQTKQIGLNRDVIKYFAMLTMLLNHIAHIFLTPGTPLSVAFTNIGYFTAITMCYFMVEGYGFTKSKRKYGIRLLTFALISQVPFTIVLQTNRLNMLFTLLFCFLILVSMEKIKNPFLKVLAIASLILLCTVCDWTWKAPLFIILFAKLKDSKRKLAIAYIVSWIIYFLYGLLNAPVWVVFYSSVGIVVSGVVMLCLYNGKRGQWGQAFSKWFFYLFYPVHLLILWMIQLWLI